MAKIKKQKPIFKIINARTYPYDILFTVSSSEEQIIKYLYAEIGYKMDDEEKKHIDIKYKAGRTVRLKNNAIILWTRTNDISVIGHEIFHVVELLMERINTPLNEYTSEPYAYLIEYLWKQVIPYLK